MEIEIRHYNNKDLDDLLITWEKASRVGHPFMDEGFFDRERHNIPNMYLPNADTWVACENNIVIGFIALIGNEVGGLFVHTDFQGVGVGKKLMDKAQNLHSSLEVDVFKENKMGRKFYERYGFKFVEEKIWEETGDVIIRMSFTGLSTS